MKGGVLFLWVLGMCLSFSLACADISTRSLFYEVWIDREIGRCQLRAELVNSRAESLRSYGVKAAARAAFYRRSKHKLVREMIEESVGTKPYKVNYFLITAHKQHQSGTFLAAR
jgi:hypothetical protein